MLNVSIVVRTNDQQQSFRPLIGNVVDQFVADHVPAAVQDFLRRSMSWSSDDVLAAEQQPQIE